MTFWSFIILRRPPEDLPRIQDSYEILILFMIAYLLEKEMATHSSVLAWRIPGMGEPSGLPSMGLQSQTRLKWLSSPKITLDSLRTNIPCLVSESESHSVMSDSWWPHGLYSPWNFPGQNTGVNSLSFLQGIFPTQGSIPGLPHCRQILYQPSRKGSLTCVRVNHNSYWATLTICWLPVFISPWLFDFSGTL